MSTFSPHADASLPHDDGPRLLADIGGTNARFALQRRPGEIGDVEVLSCDAHASFADALRSYLRQVDAPPVRHAAIAIANPVTGDEIRMTNHHWRFSLESTRREFGFDTLLAINDFTALANALPYLSGKDLVHAGGAMTGGAGALGLVGAGTGLGVGGLVPVDGGGWCALQSEGGHATFAPADALEAAILQHAWKLYPHVSFERFVSGPGIELIHRALCAIDGRPEERLRAADIVARAVDAGDAQCRRTVDCFCAMLGTIASNVAITLGALGGMYIGGGIVPRLGPLFAQSPFRARFEDKGRLGGYLARVPTWVIVAPYPAFVGVAAVLDAHLARTARDGSVRVDLLAAARGADGCPATERRPV